MSSTETLIGDALKAWRFLYRRGFIEGFGHLSARLPDSGQFLLTADAGAELIENRGPFRRVWALVESENEE